MRVMITGGTGFVGAHTVAGLIGAGHDVKLLVRSPDRVRPALEPLGVGEVETVVGDVTVPDVVESALQGCDAVIHSASVYSLDTRKDAEIRRTNIVGTETVLG
ncbi:MAG TPA: NAD(P)H-binding protein, partial [Chloroflexota bacterium]|nr:NAD(P)H-binding protein [Chloroflexota bacterium]